MAHLTPVRRLSVADQVADRLRDEILSGRAQPGDLLPPERDLAVRLGTNRGTLREATRELEALGLVRVRQGDGVRVQDFRRNGELHLLPAFVASPENADERRRALGDALRFRAVVLADVAALAAERCRDADRSRIEQAHRAVADALARGDVAAVPPADVALYRALLDASRSVVAVWAFNTFLRTFQELVMKIPALWVIAPGYGRTLARVVRAILGRRPRAARAAMEAHLRQGDHRVLRVLDRLGKDGLA